MYREDVKSEKKNTNFVDFLVNMVFGLLISARYESNVTN